MSKCLIAFYNTPSGRFRWWDEFPIAIRNMLSEVNIDCYYFYKSINKHSLYNNGEIFINPELSGDGSLNNEKWLSEFVWPIMEKYDEVIIHTHSYSPPFKFQQLIKRHKKTTWVATLHRCPTQKSSKFKQLYKMLLRRLNYLPKWYVGISNATNNYLENNFGRKNIITIHNGVNLNTQLDSRVSKSNVSHNVKRYLFINRLDKGKGVDILIDALPLILNKNENFCLTIAGDGPYEYLIENFLEQSNAPNINYIGYSSDVNSLLTTHDVLLMPYTRPQGLSLISLEARSYGLPAVYTAMGGVEETRDETNGVVMKDASAIALAESVFQIDSDAKFTDLIAGCYEGLEYFSIERMAADYVKFYKSL